MRKTSDLESAGGSVGSAAPGSPSERGWRWVDDPDLALEEGAIRDVIYGGPGYVAVGGGYDAASETPIAAIWVSADGMDWQRADLSGDAGLGEISSLIAGGPGFVAVGGHCCPDRAAVWTSADGLAWSRAPEQESLAGAAMTGVASWSGGLVAVGCLADRGCTAPAVWTSVDGQTWERVSLPLELGPVVLDDVTATGSVLVAVGSSDPLGQSPAAILVSLDAQSWTPAGVPSGTASLASVASGAQGVIATGTSFDEASGRGRAVVLVSADGAEWESRESDTFEGGATEDMLATEEGFVAVGFVQRRQTTVAASWLSSDGHEWERRLAGGRGDIRAVVRGAAGQLVGVGHVIANGQTGPGVWLATDL